MIYKILLPVLVVALFAVVWFGGGSNLIKKNTSAPTGQPIVTLAPETAVVTPTPLATIAGQVIPSGWQTYTNTQYGFTISFPANFKALTDKDNLYGWPNGVVLIYGGGQAYDIVIEVWTTEAEYKAKYPGETLPVYQVNGKFLTISDQTKSAENASIIATFNLASNPTP
jgi:hypothetical protein